MRIEKCRERQKNEKKGDRVIQEEWGIKVKNGRQRERQIFSAHEVT